MFKNTPKVSVITPTFNDDRFIIETIESVLHQTYQNIELIIVDDCSSDKTVELVKSFNDSRIRLLCNDRNYGAAYSRNIGLSIATGDYIAFLDGDDLWDCQKIEKQLAFMINNNYNFSCSYYNIINEDGTKAGIYYIAPKIITHKKFLRSNYIGCLTAMYKREIYSDLQIPTSILKRNDYALWLKLSERSSCYVLPEILASYRKRATSISSGKKSMLVAHHKKLFMELYGYNNFKSTFFAFRNVFFYGIRKIFFKKKENKK